MSTSSGSPNTPGTPEPHAHPEGTAPDTEAAPAAGAPAGQPAPAGPSAGSGTDTEAEAADPEISGPDKSGPGASGAPAPDGAAGPSGDAGDTDASDTGDAAAGDAAAGDADADAGTGSTATAGGPDAGRDGTGSDHAPAPGRPHRRRRRLVAAGAAALILLAATGGAGAWWAYHRLDGNIRTDAATNRILQDEESARPARGADPKTYGAENILLIGSDDRSGANAAYGASGGQRSDTTILLHLSADRRRAVGVSIPRDAMVHVPACERPDGSRTRPAFVQFNWAFERGGAACTIRTVEDLTGIRVDHHMIVDFTGFKRMVDAVGGVDVCLDRDVHDKDAKLDLTAGPHRLDGEQALGFVRVRETLGDGSDTARMGRQQEFLGSLVKKVQTDGVLLNPTRLWPLLDAATSSITADPGLGSLHALYGLAQSLRSVRPENVAFLTAPREPYAADRNRDQLVQPAADRLFEALKEDRPVQVAPSATPSSPTGSSPAGSASPSSPSGSPSPSAGADAGASPVFGGRTADQQVCGKS
ncbi:LCP family protein [Streptacidiphilus sp. ASG 303]|uniref:LCP family protein n=1 Tax=Streptacidiphilus sp. ASG 303 TaxID=2896847 RepID=UPI001E36D57A|nr:LCP family protein [Streptacidiphilus sp. ASG 303]MCD0481785.1 LCP family protein [Streptacidiphilus sp. ASG 303]